MTILEDNFNNEDEPKADDNHKNGDKTKDKY